MTKATLPNEVREAMARAIARAEHDSFQVGGVGEGLAELDPEAAFDCYVDHVDAALSALEAAGWVCVPKEPTEAMVEAGAGVWANHPGYRIGYKHPVIDSFSPALGGPTPSEFYAAMLTASRHKEKQDG